MHPVLLNFVNYYLQRLRILSLVDPHGLVQVDPLLTELLIVHKQRQVSVCVLGVRLAQSKVQRASMYELLGLGGIELKIVTLAAFFECD